MARAEVPVFKKDGKIEKKLGESVKIIKQDEPWSEYSLEDGTIIRIKQTMLQIVKLDEPGPDGRPAYVIQTQPNTIILPKVENE